MKALIAINSKNRGLSDYVYITYLQNIQHGDVTTGGDNKIQQIERGAPGFSMGDRPLWTLITRLYAVLKEHYASVNKDALREYAVFREDRLSDVSRYGLDGQRLKKRESRAKPSGANTHPVTAPNPLPVLPSASSTEPASARTDIATSLSSISSLVSRPAQGDVSNRNPSADAASSVPSPVPKNVSNSGPRLPPPAHKVRVPYIATIGDRVLDTHNRLLDLFTEAFNSAVDESDKLGTGQIMDKLEDQFVGLIELAGTASKMPTGSKRSGDTSRTERVSKKARGDSEMGSLQEE